VIRAEWQGLDAVYKVRKPLPYRHPALDESIRRQRTLHEAEMLHSSKDSGVSTPQLYFVDPKSSTIVMEYVPGRRLKDRVSEVPKREGEKIFFILGADVARLHSTGIVHGDVTTANVVSKDSELVFLDFGLSIHSTRVEDYAVDLRLIKETLTGAHPKASYAMESIVEGYTEQVGASRSKAVLRQLRGIERRGRYARLG
jgi:TP53 regulating kinase and related kinases